MILFLKHEVLITVLNKKNNIGIIIFRQNSLVNNFKIKKDIYLLCLTTYLFSLDSFKL